MVMCKLNQMDLQEQLQSKFKQCNVESAEGLSELGALLTELGEMRLAQGQNDAAQQYFQQAFDLQFKTQAQQLSADSTSEAAQQADAAAEAADSSQPTAASEDTAEASATTAGIPSNDDESWDKSDDWEPDLSQLKTASSFESRQHLTSGSTQGMPPEHNSSSVASTRGLVPGHDSGCQSEPGTSTSGVYGQAGRWQPQSCGGWDSSSARQQQSSGRPRGRGESKCGLSWDSDGEAEVLTNVQSLPHIVEIYNLNRSIKTSHLDDFLLDFQWGPTTANLKWVDDEHALAVFPCAEAAQALLDSPQSTFLVRPYSKASSGSLQIPVEDLLPPRTARPKTTTAVARRLISNALGNRQVRDRAAERELAEMRKANKEERQQRQQQMEEVWGN